MGALTASLTELGKKLAEANLTLGDFEASKRKIAAENADLIRVVGDLDCNLNMLMKAKSSMAAQLEETKANADNESRDNVLRQVGKAEGDASLWRAKYENEALPRQK